MIPSPDVESVIFDFDGVIVESMMNNFDAWNLTLRDVGVSIDSKQYFALEGARPIEVARHFVPDAKPEMLKKIVLNKENRYKNGPHSQLYAGIPQFLNRLKVQGIKIGLVTGSGKSRAQESLTQHNLLGSFDFIVTADDVTHGKPHPEPYLKALNLGSCLKDRTWVVENAPFGIKSAKDAGLRVVSIGTTLGEQDLALADHFCVDHRELYDFFKNTLNL